MSNTKSADEPKVPSDIRGQSRYSAKEEAEFRRLERELEQMDPQAYAELKRQYENELQQSQYGGGSGRGNGGYTVAELLVDFLSRAITNGAIIAAGAPFMRVSLLMTIQHELVRQGRLSTPYLGVVDCLTSLVEREGWRSLFRGVLLDIALIAPQKIVEATVIPFAAEVTERVAAKCGVTHASHPLVLVGFSLASLATVQLAASAVLHPIEVISQRYQTDIRPDETTPYEFTTGVNCARTLTKRAGFLGLYTGFGLSAASLVSYKLLYFLGFEFVSRVAPPSGPVSLALGITVALGAMAVTHPFDVLRQRMNTTVGNSKQYRSAAHCANEIVEKEGIVGLFAGLRVRLLLAVGSTLVRIPLGI